MYIATRSYDLTTSSRMCGLLSFAAYQQLAARRGCASAWRQMDDAQHSKGGGGGSSSRVIDARHSFC
jgi:hypothetical protein